MTVQITENEYCKIEAHYVADPKLVSSKIQEAINQIKFNKVKINGFRPGKAPDWAIKKHMKTPINDWVKRELILEAYNDVLFETKAKPIGAPILEQAELNNDKFWCSMKLFRKPNVTLNKYKEFSIPKPHSEFTSVELAEQMIQELRLNHGDSVPYSDSDFVQEGDKVTIDFSCFVDGNLVESAVRDGLLYKLGSGKGKFFEELDVNMLGMKAGEEREFSVNFDESISTDELKNTSATVKVKVHMGMKQQLHPLDDELAKKLGSESYNELRDSIALKAEERVRESDKSLVVEQIMSTLLSENTVDVPDWLAYSEMDASIKNQGYQASDITDEQRLSLLDQHKRMIALSLIFDAIREEEPEAVFSDLEIINVIKDRYAKGLANPDEFIQNASKYGAIERMIGEIRNELTIGWLLKQVTLID